MTHVLIIYEAVEPGNIETRRVFKLLDAKDILHSRGVLASHVCIEDLQWSDVLIFVRSTSSIERDLAMLAKKLGKFVILSIDDDFLSLGSSYGTDGSGYRIVRHKCLKEILKVVDCLLTVNELLAKKYIEYCSTDRYVITNTIVEKEEIYPALQDGSSKDKIKLAIYVNDGSQGLFNNILRPALCLLTKNYKEKIALYLMALRPDMSELEESFEIHFVPHMPYKDFKHFLGTEGFDIGLAPLTDTGFSKYKYFNKYIEYTLAGIPAIYSDCPLYRLVIRDHYNGILTNNSPEGWCQAISSLIEDSVQRKAIIDNAQKHLYDNFEADKVICKLVEDIPELSNHKANGIVVHFLALRLVLIKIDYSAFRVRGWIGTAYSMLRKGNVKAFGVRFKKRILKIE